MSSKRVDNSVKNMCVTSVLHVFTTLIGFVSRTIFIQILGSEFLGINGLFSNILTVLSLADLGITDAIIFNMYKPVKDHDERKIAALMTYCKKIFTTIGIIVGIVGLILTPFLKYIINSTLPIEELILYYWLYLVNTVVSYFFVYKSVIINADQKLYLTKIYYTIIATIKAILEIIVIILFKSFTLYLIINISGTILYNIIIAKQAEKRYPYINNKEYLSKEDKNKIFANTKSMFIYKIGNIIVSNTDNILISMLISTIAVGYYSNYSLIITAVVNCTNIILWSSQSSIGNFNIDSKPEQKRTIFSNLQWIMFWVYGFTAISIFVVCNDFIKLWVGEKYILETTVLVIIIVNYYMNGIFSSVTAFRQTTDLFNKTKNIVLITAIFNIILSIILGKILGLFGILLATFISNGLTTYWFEPYLLYKIYLEEKPFKYFVKIIIQILSLLFVGFITYKLTSFIVINSWLTFILKGFLCVLISNILIVLIYFKTKEFQYMFSIIKDKGTKFINRRK